MAFGMDPAPAMEAEAVRIADTQLQLAVQLAAAQFRRRLWPLDDEGMDAVGNGTGSRHIPHTAGVSPLRAAWPPAA